MRDYWTFDVIAFIRDYYINQIALANKKDELEELTELSSFDYSAEKVQTQTKHDGLENGVLRRLKIENDIKVLERYFERFERGFYALDSDGKIVVEAYKQKKVSPIYYIMSKTHCEKSKAYRLKDESLEQFAEMVKTVKP